jgi:hypothetical protein
MAGWAPLAAPSREDVMDALEGGRTHAGLQMLVQLVNNVPEHAMQLIAEFPGGFDFACFYLLRHSLSDDRSTFLMCEVLRSVAVRKDEAVIELVRRVLGSGFFELLDYVVHYWSESLTLTDIAVSAVRCAIALVGRWSDHCESSAGNCELMPGPDPRHWSVFVHEFRRISRVDQSGCARSFMLMSRQYKKRTDGAHLTALSRLPSPRNVEAVRDISEALAAEVRNLAPETAPDDKFIDRIAIGLQVTTDVPTMQHLLEALATLGGKADQLVRIWECGYLDVELLLDQVAPADPTRRRLAKPDELVSLGRSIIEFLSAVLGPAIKKNDNESCRKFSSVVVPLLCRLIVTTRQDQEMILDWLDQCLRLCAQPEYRLIKFRRRVKAECPSLLSRVRDILSPHVRFDFDPDEFAECKQRWERGGSRSRREIEEMREMWKSIVGKIQGHRSVQKYLSGLAEQPMQTVRVELVNSSRYIDVIVDVRSPLYELEYALNCQLMDPSLFNKAAIERHMRDEERKLFDQIPDQHGLLGFLCHVLGMPRYQRFSFQVQSTRELLSV